MRLDCIDDLTCVLLNEQDLQVLKKGGACHIKGKYLVLTDQYGYSLVTIKEALKLDTEMVIIVSPDQLPLLEEGIVITYAGTVKLSTVKTFDDYMFDRCG